MRGIPFWWTCIDMSFGVFGIVPLFFAYRLIRRLESANQPREPVAGLVDA